jgi:hypothetical protein
VLLFMFMALINRTLAWRRKANLGTRNSATGVRILQVPLLHRTTPERRKRFACDPVLHTEIHHMFRTSRLESVWMEV